MSQIYALSSVKFLGLKLRLCKKKDKYEVWVAVQNMRSNHLLKPRLLLYFLLVNTCFSQTTIQPTQKDGCPLFLVHGGSGWRLPIFSSTLSFLLSLKLLLPGGSDIFLVSTRCVPAVRRLNILIIIRYQAGDTG